MSDTSQISILVISQSLREFIARKCLYISFLLFLKTVPRQKTNDRLNMYKYFLINNFN